MLHSGLKNKPIPYSKMFNNQLIQQQNQDSMIPDQHSNRNHHHPKESMILNELKYQKHNKAQQNTLKKETNAKGANAFNKTYASGCIAEAQTEITNKKLTYGMTSYKDIKYSHLIHMSGSREKNKTQSRSGSKSKLNLKLNQQFINSTDRDSVQCTFTPKTNTGQTYKNFKDFVNFQQDFLTKKEQKIQRMKQQMLEKQSAEVTLAPKIDKKSRKISESGEKFHLDQNGSLKKISKKTPIHERLYNLPRKKDRTIEDQDSFTPKILNKSKSMIRSDKVENLLYEDAQRRIEQQKLLESDVYQKQQMASKYPPLINSTKQNKHNNKLICKKIRSQFLQLLQTEWDQETANTISPILALTVLSEIFNVEINPNKNQQLCFFVLSLLTEDDKGKTKHTEKGERYVETRRLWDFIKAIMIGVEGYDKAINCFTEDEVRKIHSQLGYFYSHRLSKISNKPDEENGGQNQLQIELSQRTKKMAEAHRSRRLQQISEFISETNVVQIISNETNTQKGNNGQKMSDEKTITLQDLFILDSIRKKSENEKKKMMKQQQQIKKCTFRPSLNQNSIQKAMERKARSKQNLKTVSQHPKQFVVQVRKQVVDKQNEDRSKKIVIKGKKNLGRESIGEKSKVQQGGSCRNIKNVDKTILRLNLGRKMKEIEKAQKARGYGGSQNWLEEMKSGKKQVLGELQNFLGYKQKCTGKAQNGQKQANQNYQSCQIK